MDETTYRLYIAGQQLVEWWMRYDQVGPTGGYREFLQEAVDNFEKKLQEEGIATAKERAKEVAQKMLKNKTRQ